MPLTWLLAGIGDISTRRVLPAILAEPQSRLVGVVTRNPAKAAPYGVPAWPNLEAALEAGSADAVYIATPVFMHAALTIAALRAGRHVLCEKPMAMNYEQALTMQHAAEETGRTLGISYYRRMYPKVQRAVELLKAGAIGRPVFAEATCHDWFYPAGTSREWLLDPAKSGGGPLYDIACHRIDLTNYLFGRPLHACGYRSTLVHPIAVEDNATVLTEHESGVRTMVDVRWHSRVARDEFRIRGTEGEMDLTPLNSNALVYRGISEEVPPAANLHYPCVEDFVQAVREGRPPRSSGATALDTEWVMAQVNP
jgi:predicted dehydrogenase